MSPGWSKEWHVGVRATVSGKLVAFISAIPVALRVRNKTLKASEVNFLCIHKKLRSKRLAPVLIKEITRRCNLEGTWQAIYTAGVVLPKPVSTCRYYHRSLDWKKLHEVKFSPLPPGSTPDRQVRKFALPSNTSTKGLRPMEAKDIDDVLELCKNYLAKFDMAPVFTREEIEHWLFNKIENPAEQVIWCYVVEVIFYHLVPIALQTNIFFRIPRRRSSLISFLSIVSNHPSLATLSTLTFAPLTCSIMPRPLLLIQQPLEPISANVLMSSFMTLLSLPRNSNSMSLTR